MLMIVKGGVGIVDIMIYVAFIFAIGTNITAREDGGNEKRLKTLGVM